jgi:hydroxyacylglutathione hydrolase
MPPVRFRRCPHPGANSVLLTGPRPVLVDTGFGAHAESLEAWLATQGVAPGKLSLVVNTHHHSDHVGGNHRMQSRHGVPIAAHALEAETANARAADACGAWWLDQPVEAYSVARLLRDGDRVETGDVSWQVLHTPGHSPGHVSLYAAEARALVVGDVLHADDIGWLAPLRSGADGLAQARASVERLAALEVRIAWSGHGPVIEDPPAALAAALQRLERWEAEPERAAWHACKRIFASALMIAGGVAEAGLPAFLLRLPWFREHAGQAFGLTPEDFVAPLLAEMLRAGAARWQDGKLVATAEHEPVPPGWPSGPVRPADWPEPAAIARGS